MKNLLIIQARMGSSRLPNKVLKELCGKPMLQHIIERVQKCKNAKNIVVATTDKEIDDIIEELCKKIEVDCYRGSENDVLDRYYQAAMKYKPDNVIRVTADCPLIDAGLIDYIISEHIYGDYDYTSNTLVETYPDGLDAEVFTFSALKDAWENAVLASEREHVTPYIKYKGTFNRKSIERKPSLAEKRWTVDTNEDFAMIERIYNSLYQEDRCFWMDEVLGFLDKNGLVEKINKGIERNEGYKKSLLNDYEIRKEIQ